MIIQLGYLRITLSWRKFPANIIYGLLLIAVLFAFPILLIPITQEFTYVFFGTEISQGLALFLNWLLLSYMAGREAFSADSLH